MSDARLEFPFLLLLLAETLRAHCFPGYPMTPLTAVLARLT